MNNSINKKRNISFNNSYNNKKLKYQICKLCKDINNKNNSLNLELKKCEICIKIQEYKLDSSILTQRSRINAISLQSEEKKEIEKYLQNPTPIHRNTYYNNINFDEENENYNYDNIILNRPRSHAISLSNLTCEEIDLYINKELNNSIRNL